MSEANDRANKILDGESSVPDYGNVKKLVRELKGDLEFARARKLLTRAREEYPDKTWIIQQQALCTYKDEELLRTTRFENSLKLLEEIGLRDPDEAVKSKKIKPKTIPETLSLGGAIYKRKWEYEGQMEDLSMSRLYYQAAWERDWKEDRGYGGVNAAYVLDILAARSKTIVRRSGLKPEHVEEARELQEKARELRVAMEAKVLSLSKEDPDLKNQYWYLVTMAEIYFGLENYDEAGKWLVLASKAEAKEWERETTFKQLVSIARLNGHVPPPEGTDMKKYESPWKELCTFLGEDTGPALSCYRGKVGLALSGGGFRASLFHIGVLARLAEMDVLRSVEVLSTVSGGSIVGAHYYLEVQHLLQSCRDRDISREDYIEVIKRVQQRFLAGVQKNLRTEALSDFSTNLKMIYTREYSRSHRLGELYENELYSMIGEDGEPREKPRIMKELLVDPLDYKEEQEKKEKDEQMPFKPKFLNWRRRAKVPVLLLNTTSLNSGHSWHFTASWMGEPPGSVGSGVDVNERYRRLWYDQAPEDRHRNYRLGYAVAASACVPGLFEPLVLEGLYPGRTVRLVDGGVHDNQGVEALLDEGCTLVLCSDASGQMEDIKRPSDSIIGVPLRSNSILMDRVRETEYQDLRARVNGSALQGLFFIHLKKDLEPLPIDWTDCQNPTVPPHYMVSTTPYGIDRDLQRKLADIRTDLDSFSEVEAYSLMLSGYLMTEHEFRELDNQRERDGEQGTWGSYDINAPRKDWPFLDLENLMRQAPDSSDARRDELGRQLEAGSALFFKIWKLNPTLRKIAWAGGSALLILLLWFVYEQWDTSITYFSVSVGGIAFFLLLTILTVFCPFIKWLKPQAAVRGYLNKAVFALAGYIGSTIHLKVFDPLFIKWGKLDRLLRLK